MGLEARLKRRYEELVTKEEVLSTYTNQAQHGQTHLNELSQRIEWLEGQGGEPDLR